MGSPMREAERAEKLEAEIDSLIEKRAAEKRDEGAVEELWRDSTRRHNEQRREELGAAWRAYHLRMREVHARLADEHEARALRTGPMRLPRYKPPGRAGAPPGATLLVLASLRTSPKRDSAHFACRGSAK